ncbi:receptor-type tyrosine-protein phosphatase eta [Erpetoichthys calabaricus]|uniref:receptor-type tyrosine-protein phosphatase eta n=1 Tax=Erpetoichthys calabaricus TaxID=27687 RepID=UPI0022344413|nr:receptor-type tyrosine-protein phosphatase eta [Erpetoichthys calabaricus]
MTSMNLCWGAPVGGNVSYGVNYSRNGQSTQLVTSKTCINVTRLKSATSYSFFVFAVAGDNMTVGDSVTITAFTKPGPITSPSASNVTTTSISLCWVAPVGGNVSYGVNFSTNGQSTRLVTNNTCINVTGLNSATSYLFFVFAVAGDNMTVGDSVTITAFTKPGPITSPSASNVTTTSIRLCWVAPVGGNVSYGVNFSTNGQSTQLVTNYTCINVTGLNSSTSYSFFVFVVTGDNVTVGDSVTITAFTIAGDNMTLGDSVTITAFTIAGDNMTVGDLVTILAFTITGDNMTVGDSVTITAFTIAGDNMTLGDSVTITAFTIAGDNITVGDSVTITAFTKPGPITSPSASNVTTTSMSLCWVAPVGGNVSYVVNFLTNGQITRLVTNNTCINVKGLNSATSYSFFVFAVAGDNMTVGDSVTITAFTSE